MEHAFEELYSLHNSVLLLPYRLALSTMHPVLDAYRRNKRPNIDSNVEMGGTRAGAELEVDSGRRVSTSMIAFAAHARQVVSLSGSVVSL
jgi:hypothetical protein